MRYKIEESKPHWLERYDVAGIVRRIQARREAVLRALVEHVGGIDAARERVAWSDREKWDPTMPLFPIPSFFGESGDWSETFANDSNDAIFLDGVRMWIGGYDTKLRWRERFTPECPAEVADAVPAELRG